MILNIIKNSSNKSFIIFNKFYILRYLNLIHILNQKKIYNKKFKIIQFKNLNNIIKNIYQILKKGYIFKLITKGLGFNFSILNKKLKININASHCFSLKINPKLKIINTKNFLYFYSHSKELVLKYVYLIYKLKKINKYKNIGILLFNKNYKYKAGKVKKK
jgi:ribosomal protein L6P/L9E